MDFGHIHGNAYPLAAALAISHSIGTDYQYQYPIPYQTLMQHEYKTQHSTVTELHTLNNTVAKGFNQIAPPVRTITVALDMSKTFNIHTLIRKLLQKTFQAQSLSSSQTTSRNAKPSQHKEITHLHNVNSKLAFHKVVSFHQHYLTFTPQTYHHQEHQFRSWPTHMTSPSHPHTQARV